MIMELSLETGALQQHCLYKSGYCGCLLIIEVVIMDKSMERRNILGLELRAESILFSSYSL